MWTLKKEMIQMNLFTNINRLTDLENKFMVAKGEEQGEGRIREFGMNMYTLLYVKWITNKDPLYSKGNSAQCYVAAWMGGQPGYMYMYG